MKKTLYRYRNLFFIFLIIYLLSVSNLNINGNKQNNNAYYFGGENGLKLSEVLITIKTSSQNHNTRIKNIVDTWYKFAKNQIYVVTDIFDKKTNDLLDGKLIPTNCPKDRNGLCCKFGSELALYFSLEKNFKWFCHFDDDNYLNVPNLIDLLDDYDHNDFHYLGKSSWDVPVIRNGPAKYIPGGYAKFWFGTFGAGVCLSNKTLYKIKKHASGESYSKGCLNMGLPDDTYLGFILEWQNKIFFKNITKMNHHLEVNQFKNMEAISEQITFSFGKTYFKYYSSDCNCKKELLIIPEIENLYGDEDPLRLKSLHCLIFPETNDCKLLLTKALIKLKIQEKDITNLKLKINNTTLKH